MDRQRRHGLKPFDFTPRDFRRGSTAPEDGTFQVGLDVRPPLDWEALLGFLGARAFPGVEVVDANPYIRTLAILDRGEFHVMRGGLSFPEANGMFGPLEVVT